MLVIRKRQKQLLGRALFDRWIVAHVERFFPLECAELGPARVRATVTEAVSAAQDLGFEGEREIGQFVDLSFLFGAGFHRSRRHRWARSVLEDASITDPRERAARLYDAALERLRAGVSRSLARSHSDE